MTSPFASSLSSGFPPASRLSLGGLGATAVAQPLRAGPRLRAGDRVALVAPSSHQGRSPESFLPAAVALLQGWGLEVVPRPQPEPRHLYFAGRDAERAAAFQAHYLDPTVRALLVTRGGYGAARLLPLLDATAIAQAPAKTLVGFSDATALFAYLHTVAGVQALHGPCLAAPGALTAPQRAESLKALRRQLFDDPTAHETPSYPLRQVAGAPWAANAATLHGNLFGGCLSVWASLAGTAWLPQAQGAFLFLEDVGEAPYRLDRMLTQLQQAGAFRETRAIIFGYLSSCDNGRGDNDRNDDRDEAEPAGRESEQKIPGKAAEKGKTPGLLEEMLRDLFRDAAFPVFRGLPAGHGDPNLTLRLGGPVELAPRGAEGIPHLTGC